jgi:hypothetical protein
MSSILVTACPKLSVREFRNLSSLIASLSEITMWRFLPLICASGPGFFLALFFNVSVPPVHYRALSIAVIFYRPDIDRVIFFLA